MLVDKSLPQCTMEFTSFIISILFTSASRPAQIQTCFKITDLVKGQCTFYNSTALSSKEQVHNALIIEHFKPLFSSSCLLYAQILVCSTLVFYISSHCQGSTMPPPLPRHKIILYSPFLRKQYSMAIHTELLKTAISSSSLYFSTLATNCVFSCLCPCVVVISIFSVLQFSTIFTHDLILAVSLPLTCLVVFLPLILLYVRRLLFPRSQPPTSNNASVIFTPHTAPPSPIPSSSSTLPSLPQPSATPTPTLPPLPPKLCVPIYKNTERRTIYPVTDLC